MPRPVNYECPRCLYSTTIKKLMHRHLYKTKSLCVNKTGIDLTDEIKGTVLKFHTYVHKPELSNNNTLELPITHLQQTIYETEPKSGTIEDDGNQVKRIYQCPRCGYTIPLKKRMERHLYELKNPCPTNLREITLTKEIKQKILQNYSYHVVISQAESCASYVSNTELTNNKGTITRISGNLQMDEISSKQVSIIDQPTLIAQSLITNVTPIRSGLYQSNFSENGPDNLQLQKEDFSANSAYTEDRVEITDQIVKRFTRNDEHLRDKARRHRSRSRGCSQLQNTKFIYLYELVPKFKTRSEALRKINISNTISESVVICKEDLGKKILIKGGKTKICPYGRQDNYTRLLTNLYDWNFRELVEYEIDETFDLDAVENAVLDKLWEPEKVGLVRDDGNVYWPNEVFRAESLASAQKQTEVAIYKYQQFQQITLNTVSSEERYRLLEYETKLEELRLKRVQEENKLEEMRFRRTQDQK